MSGAAHSSERQAGMIVAGHNNSWLWLLSIAVLSSLTILSVLFVFDPDGNPFYPGCIFHRTTGLLCPGCGSLRALHQLLHGHFITAFRFNPLWVVSLAALAVMGVLYQVRKQTLPWFKPRWLWALGIVFLAVSIWRNLPGAPALI